MASPPIPVHDQEPSLLEKIVAAIERWWQNVPRSGKLAMLAFAVAGLAMWVAFNGVRDMGGLGNYPSITGPPSPPDSPITLQTGVYWNAWAAADSARKVPVERIAVESDFRVALDLSALNYRAWHNSVASISASAATQTLLRTPERDSRLRILFVPDPLYFESIDSPLKDIDLPQTRIAAAGAVTAIPTVSPFASIDQADPPEYVFGRSVLRLRTKKRQGWAAVGISIWDGIRPIDELAVLLCVGGPCSGRPVQVSSLRGLSSLSLAIDAPQTDVPAAALHFLDLGTGSAIGVFHRRGAWSEDRFVTWRLNDNLQLLDDWIKNTLSPAFQAAQGNNNELEQRGRDLFNKLFPDDDEGSEARAEFIRFVKESPRSLLFVRMLPHSSDLVPVVPLGLMVVPGLQLQFVGFQIKVQTPLPVQAYGPGDACGAKWIMLIPPEQSGLQAVREQLGSGIERWRKTRDLHEGISSFRNWAQSPERLEEPAVLLTLSHHDRERLYFDDSESVMAASMLRRFAPASLAILNGCGTGKTGAAGIVRQLNERGIGSVIATATEVSPSLAADFVTVFEREIVRPVGAYTALHNTVLKLAQMEGPNGGGVYGPQALAYMLLGNGNIALCGNKEAAQR